MTGVDPTVQFLALLELIEDAQPGPDGMLPPEVQQAIKLLVPDQGGAQFSLEDDGAAAPSCDECYGSEPPGPGWMYAGECRWVRGRRRAKEVDDAN